MTKINTELGALIFAIPLSFCMICTPSFHTFMQHQYKIVKYFIFFLFFEMSHKNKDYWLAKKKKRGIYIYVYFVGTVIDIFLIFTEIV